MSLFLIFPLIELRTAHSRPFTLLNHTLLLNTMLNKAFSLATVAAVIVLAAASEPATLPSYQGALLLQGI